MLGFCGDNGKENGIYYLGFRVSQHKGYHFKGPHKKNYSILGSILGSSYFGKLPSLGFRFCSDKLLDPHPALASGSCRHGHPHC